MTEASDAPVCISQGSTVPGCHPSHPTNRSSSRQSSTSSLSSSRVVCSRFHKRPSSLAFKMMPVMISMIMRSLMVSGQNCFGGIETFEKVAMTDFDENFTPAGILLQQLDQALTRDCINLCKQQPSCLSFGLDYTKFRCAAYSINSIGRRQDMIYTNTTNLFEKVCYRGIARDEYEKICGIERLWSFERVQGAFLEGFEKLQLNNIASRSECAKACLMENTFACRSADYDETLRICRLSREDRRTQPQAFRVLPGSNREYIENQCAAPGPTTCLYETKHDVGVITMDSLVFANNPEDCQFKCDKEHTFNCRSYSITDKRCFLSGDDSVSLSSALLPVKFGSLYGEKRCVTEQCSNGVFTYEKITGYVMRSAITTNIKIKNTGNLGITSECRNSCDESSLGCPAFSINYSNSRCEKLDRNTQGRTLDLNPQEGESLFEKVCLRIPDIVQSQCQDKFWAFERVIGHEMTPVSYIKTYNFVQSRRDCQEYCLHEKEFTCRSALYNEETTDCRLSPDDRRTKSYNFVRNNNHKISYLENQCIRDHSRCPFSEVSNAYPTYTDIVEREEISSVESCENMCNDNRRFLCRSFAFYSSNQQCFLSGDDRISGGITATQSRPGMSYFERKCELIPNSSSHEGINVSSIDDEPMISHGLSSGMREGTSLSDVEVRLRDDTDSLLTTTTTTSSSSSLSSSSTPTTTSEPEHSHGSPPVGSSYPSNPDGLPAFKHLKPVIEEPHGSDHVHTPKCGANSKFTFERVPNFEPVGGYLNLLFSDNNNPGIVPECQTRCSEHPHCRAFILDYNQRSCHGIFENSSIGKFDLRLSIGKDYFQGFCVPNHLTCGKDWHFDRIVDQASVGPNPKQVIRFISKTDCKIKCLEERRFICASVSFDGHLNECKLFDTDRHSGLMSLSFTKGIDYMENQCSFNEKQCQFLPYERDVAMISITKSVRGSSTFFCEQQCMREKTFNCRSFTYIDQSSIPGANLCFLSTDSRKSSPRGSTTYRPRALYGERDCSLQTGSNGSSGGRARSLTQFIGMDGFHRGGQSIPPMSPSSSATATSTAARDGRINFPSSNSNSMYGNNPMPGSSLYGSHMYGQAPNPMASSHYGPSASSSYSSSMNHPYSQSPASNMYGTMSHSSNPMMNNQYYGPAPGSSPSSHHMTMSNMNHYERPPPAQMHHALSGYGSNSPFLLPHHNSFSMSDTGLDLTKTSLDDPNGSCNYHQYTFEKTFGYDIRYARKDRSRLPPRLGISVQCQDECLRRRFKCNAFVIEYGPTQSCFFLEESAAENRKILQKVPEVAYFEKICLKERNCGKLWTFDRVIGFDLEETPEKEIPSVHVRTDCQDYCLGEKSFTCRSATYNYKSKICRLFTETRRSKPHSFKGTLDDVDYMENHCAKEPPTCQYKDHNDMYFPYVDRLTNAFSLADCQRQCDGERLFSCRAVSYETFARDCALYSEDLSSLIPSLPGSSIPIITTTSSTTTSASPGSLESSSTSSFSSRSSSIITSFLQQRRHSIYSEKGSCEQVSVQCTQQDMLLTLNFDTPFSGRVYAKGNPSQCYVLGTGGSQLQFAISLGSKCGTRPEGEKNFANEVVIQQHPVIMTDSDRTVRVLCSFEAIDQTVTLMSPNAERPGIDVQKSYLFSGGIEPPSATSETGGQMSSSSSLIGMSGRSRVDNPITSVVTNTAPPPSVIMRILDRSQRDATVVGLGDELTLQIELRDPSSAFGLFARNLYARSSTGESLFLLDNSGCPTDSIIFPGLSLEPSGSKALRSTFKAFRFPSSGIVNFEVQVRFCQDKCDAVKCPSTNPIHPQSESFGRRRRRRDTYAGQVPVNGSSHARSPYSYPDAHYMSTNEGELPHNPLPYTSYQNPHLTQGSNAHQPFTPSSAMYPQPANTYPHGLNHPAQNAYPPPYSSYPMNDNVRHPSMYPPYGINTNPFTFHMNSPHIPSLQTTTTSTTPSPNLNSHQTSRPMPSSDKGKFRPPRPLPRPKEKLIAQGPTDTLRTTIMVGDKDVEDVDKWGSDGVEKKNMLKGSTHYERKSAAICHTGPVILYTAIIVTLLHVAIIVAGYIYYRRIGYSTSARIKLFSTPSYSTENIGRDSDHLSTSNSSSSSSSGIPVSTNHMPLSLSPPVRNVSIGQGNKSGRSRRESTSNTNVFYAPSSNGNHRTGSPYNNHVPIVDRSTHLDHSNTTNQSNRTSANNSQRFSTSFYSGLYGHHDSNQQQ